MKRPPALLLPFLALAPLVCVARAAPSPTDEVTLELPALIVEASRHEPEWLYASTPGVEILSSCPRGVTRDFARSHARLRQRLGTFVPERFLWRTATPVTLVLISDQHEKAIAAEFTAELMRRELGREAAGRIQAHEQVREALAEAARQRGDPPRPPPVRIAAPPRFLPNLSICDRDTISSFAVLRESEFKGSDLTLTEDHLRLLLEHRAPPLPRWFVDGILDLYRSAILRENTLVLPRFAWQPAAEITSHRRALVPGGPPTGTPGLLLPMPHVFEPTPDGADEPPEGYARRQRQQRQLFLRWCLDPEGGACPDALARLVDRATREPVTEDLFNECFGATYSHIRAQLEHYLFTKAGMRAVRVPSPANEAPRPEARPASVAEVARIKGDWERLLTGYVRDRHPEYADRYAEQARRTLQRAHDRGAADPGVIATQALLECDSGHDETALPLLESVVRAGATRPRLRFELARIRYLAAKARPAGDDHRLSGAQAADIIEPLFAVRELAPPMPEVYRLIATTWRASATAPSHEDLAILDEGVGLFPGDIALVYQAAALCADHGFVAEATRLTDHGLRLALDEGNLIRFSELKARLDDRLRPATAASSPN